MKIFNVDVEANKFQTVLPTLYDSEIHNMLTFDGTSKMSNWKPLKFYVDSKLEVTGNFFALSYGNAFACDKTAVAVLGEYFSSCGELLPICLDESMELYILNVTNCLSVFDGDNAKFDYYKDGTKGKILEYSFKSQGFAQSTIFKIPETAKTQVLTYTIPFSSNDFYNAYFDSGLQGLIFKELFSNE